MDECLRWAADVMFKHVNKNMAAFLCQEWEDFVLYNSKVLICGDREGLGRDTQGFLRGAFARISLIAGVSQLSWGKLLFIRHFSCLHLLMQSSLIWAAKEWPDSAGRNASGNTEEEAVWLTNVRNWYYLALVHLTMRSRQWSSSWQHLSWSSLKSDQLL